MAAWQWHHFGWGDDGVTRIALTDEIPLAEDLTARIVLGLTESVSATETVEVVAKAYIVVSDSIPVAESVALSVLNYINLSENIPVVETPEKVVYSFGGGGAVTLHYAMVDDGRDL